MLTVLMVSLLSIISLESCDPGPDEVRQDKIDSHYVFTASNNYLYVISNDKLDTYTLEQGVIKLSTDSLGAYGGEAVFSQNNTLVIGSSGSSIYDISHPGQLNFVSGYSDLLPCDEFVIKDHYVFASLRIRDDCHPAGTDALRIIDISSTTSLMNSISIDTPYGLSIDGDVLFLCGGLNGLSVFDVHDPLNVILIKHYNEIKGEYSNAAAGLLLVTNDSFIEQYDYSDINNLKLLSKIPVQR